MIKNGVLVKVKYHQHRLTTMAKAKTKNPPLMSSAGIMRYFEEEKTKIKISPKSVLVSGLVIGILVIILNAYYGLWPG